MNVACLRNSCIGLTVMAVFTVADVRVEASGSHPSTRRPRLDATLQAVFDAGSRDPQRVIIRVRPGARLALRRTLTAHGDQILGEHASIDALTAVIHAGDLDALSQDDAVASISADAVVRADGLLGGLLGAVLKLVGGLVGTVANVLLPGGADTAGPAVPPRVLRETLGLNDTYAGRAIGVAVIDSGLEMSPEFEGRVTASYDFTRGGIATSPYDDYGHGTHVASTIGGSGALSASRDYHGLAPRVSFTILKVLDKNGAGWTSDVIRAVDFAVANRTALKIDIINLSLGHPIYEPAATDPLVQAVERAVRAGVVVVAAAGNLGTNPTTGLPGYAGITSPGNAASAITVGAARTEDTVSRGDDSIPNYSSRGPTWYDAIVKPDVVAPGHNIVAAAARRGTLYQTYPQLAAADTDYMRLSGTSMATAVTTGVVALMLEANRTANGYPARPSLTPNAVKAVLHHTAFGIHDALGVEYDVLTKGAGALNGKGAIDLARAINTSVAAGSLWLTAPPAPWTTIGGQGLGWNQSIIWDNGIIWGNNLMAVNQTAWSTGIIWGNNDVMWSSGIIWGNNLVWTDPQMWSTGIIWGNDTIGITDGEGIIWGNTNGITPETTAWGNLAGSTTGAVAGASVAPRP